MDSRNNVTPLIESLRLQVRTAPSARRLGRVTGITGLIIESEGPNVGLGEICMISSDREAISVMAEVVGFRGERVLLMPLGETGGLHPGCEVAAWDRPPLPVADEKLLGRVLGGVSTSILFSSFESWMVHEHHDVMRHNMLACWLTPGRCLLSSGQLP